MGGGNARQRRRAKRKLGRAPNENHISNGKENKKYSMVQEIIDTLLTSVSLDKRFNITHLHTVRNEATAIVTKVLKTSNDPINASSIL